MISNEMTKTYKQKQTKKKRPSVSAVYPFDYSSVTYLIDYPHPPCFDLVCNICDVHVTHV